MNLKEYFKEKNLAPVNQGNLDAAALDLTSHLVLQQEYASPVVLNMIVAALLLQTTATKLMFKDIFEECKRVYDYLVRRGGVKMIMRIPPRAESVLDTIVKLGFTVTEVIEKRKSRVKKFEINMDAKRDQKILLGLSYYSNNLL